tara:strand:- start:1612 stop:1794 length:183 start_codon:yes stop_codon:yes gene_type:complete
MYSEMIEALETAGRHALKMQHAWDEYRQGARRTPECDCDEIEMVKEVVEFLNKHGFEGGA